MATGGYYRDRWALLGFCFVLLGLIGIRICTSPIGVVICGCLAIEDWVTYLQQLDENSGLEEEVKSNGAGVERHLPGAVRGFLADGQRSRRERGVENAPDAPLVSDFSSTVKTEP